MVRDERVDDVGQQVDHPVARVDVKRLDPLAIDSHETLGGQAEVSNAGGKVFDTQDTHIIVVGLEVDIDPVDAPLDRRHHCVVGDHVAGHLARHHVVQKNLP